MKFNTIKQFGFLLSIIVSKLLAQEIPITTTSDEARALYIQALELGERYRNSEAKRLYEQALAKDSSFTLAWLALAFMQTTNQENRAFVAKARVLSEKASEGEKLLVQIRQAQFDSDPTKRKALMEQLLQLYPNDKRVQEAMGLFFHFWLNEPDAGIPFYKKAIELDPAYHSAYNNLGYAYANLGNYDEAGKTLKQYVELLPNEPNPHDTYAEVLMKQGKFDESISEYKKSLSIDPQFYFSHIGLGMNYVLTGKPDEGRRQFEKLYDVASDDNDRSRAITATMQSYVFEEDYDKAIIEQKKDYALSEKAKDVANMALGRIRVAELYVEAGKPKEATRELQRALTLINGSQFPTEPKAQMLQSLWYQEALVAFASSDVATAKAKLKQYADAANIVGNALQVKRAHQLAGRIALQEKRYDDALAELQQADQRNAQTLFITAQVYQVKGDRAKAKEFFSKAANFNDMSWEYALVRKRAKEELASLK
jgi:tetratricopeptide (TPR) repeat protein